MPCLFNYCLFIYLFMISQILATCPYIRTSVILAECVFDTSVYISLGAHIFNTNSIDFMGHYSFNNNNVLSDTLIYNLGDRWMLLVPLLVKCSNQPVDLQFTECQYTMRQNKYASKSSSMPEYMTTQLTVINITNIGMQSVLFVQPGDITLRSCKAYDCSKELVYLTASNETFNFKISYEKSIGTKCHSDDDCNNKYSITNLIHCDRISQTCQCYDENGTTINISGIGRVCIDSIEQSNCTKYSQRCLKWCDQSQTSNCVCPTHTRKVRKISGLFDCELEPNGVCHFDDQESIGLNVRKCPTGTLCDGQRCQPVTINRPTYDNLIDETTTSLLSSSSSSPATTTTTTTTTTTEYLNLLTSKKQLTSATMNNFLRLLIVIAIVSFIFFIIILISFTILVKSNRFDLSASSEDKISSFSSTQSTTTALSTDFFNDIYQFKPTQTNFSIEQTRNYENYIPTKGEFGHGLVPRTNLSPRFYRQYQGLDERRRRQRAPLYIQSPKLARHNTILDSRFNQNKSIDRKIHQPRVTRLQNGDVLISA